MKLSAERIEGIIRRHRPRGWTLRFRASGPAAIAYVDDKTRVLKCPRIVDRETLFFFFHEVGHIRCGHFDDKVVTYVEEYEAERYAIAAMRAEGIPVSRQSMIDARERLRLHIADAERKGVRIIPRIRKWSKS